MGRTSGGSQNSPVVFPATVVDNADPNTLDDYEEGTWIPSLGDNNLDGSGETQVYSAQVGRYTKIGNRCFIQGRMTITDLGGLTTTEAARLLGLPFTPASTTNSHGNLTVGSSASLAIAEGTIITAHISPALPRASLQLWDAVTGTSSLLISELSDGADLIFAGVFEV